MLQFYLKMPHMANIVGRRVREARLAKGLTQDQLASALQLGGRNISRTGVAKIEMELRSVTDIELKLLAKTLKVSVGWLMGEKES
jgi:transcriptional regulator with XRE-family HTH domain